MTAIAKPVDWISPEEYLEGELKSDIRHEYVDGRVFAMAGASADHNRVAGNIFRELSTHLLGKPCEAFINDMKVRMPEAEAFYYPDVFVVCDSADNHDYFRDRPSHLFEVISPNTERIDRREKMLAYREIPGIQTYVIFEQDRMQATILRAAESGWETEIIHGPEAVLSLPDLGFKVPLARIYDRTAIARQTS